MLPCAEKVAARYVQAATIAGKKFYHGTYLEDAKKIKRGGFVLARRRGRGASMGPAVYMSAKRSWALDYVNDIVNWEGKPGALLTLRLRPGIKFLDVSDVKKWPPEVAKEYAGPFKVVREPIDWRKVGIIARRQKYDAAGNPDGTVAVFDPRSIQVVGMEEFQP